MMKTFVKSSSIAGALMCGVFFFTACSHDDDPTPSPRPQGTVSTELKMTKSGFAYFSFATNQMVEMQQRQKHRERRAGTSLSTC